MHSRGRSTRVHSLGVTVIRLAVVVAATGCASSSSSGPVEEDFNTDSALAQPTTAGSETKLADGEGAAADSCEAFAQLGLSAQVSQVDSGDAPSGDACAAEVANAEAARTVMGESERYSVGFTSGSDVSVVDAGIECGETTRFYVDNKFDLPVVAVGATWVAPDETGNPVLYEPFFTRMIARGDRLTSEPRSLRGLPESRHCNFLLKPTVVVEALRPMDPAPPDGVATPDERDPGQWFPGLQQARNDAMAAGDFDTLVDRVFDAHSSELPVAQSRIRNGVVYNDGLEYCAVLDVEKPSDIEADITMLLLSGATDNGEHQGLHVAAFSRGNDGQWRYLTDPIPLGASPSPSDPCAPPQLLSSLPDD